MSWRRWRRAAVDCRLREPGTAAEEHGTTLPRTLLTLHGNSTDCSEDVHECVAAGKTKMIWRFNVIPSTARDLQFHLSELQIPRFTRDHGRMARDDGRMGRDDGLSLQ